jgi:hypothetical protein
LAGKVIGFSFLIRASVGAKINEEPGRRPGSVDPLYRLAKMCTESRPQGLVAIDHGSEALIKSSRVEAAGHNHAEI